MGPDLVWLAGFRRRLRRLVRVRRGCWVWRLSVNPKGYARVRVKWENGRWSVTTAHRMAAAALTGRCPEDLEFHHVCPRRRCVNPAHGQWVPERDHNNSRW